MENSNFNIPQQQILKLRNPITDYCAQDLPRGKQSSNKLQVSNFKIVWNLMFGD